MKHKITKAVIEVSIFTAIVALIASSTLALAAINATSIQAENNVGVISSIAGAFIWAFNLFRYLGWAGVIVGVGLAIFSLIYKLFSGDSEEAMKQVQSYITKAVIIVIAGILLISAGFIIRQVGALIGVTETNDYTIEVIGGTGGGAPAASPPAVIPPSVPPVGFLGGTCTAISSGAGGSCQLASSNCDSGYTPTVTNRRGCICNCVVNASGAF